LIESRLSFAKEERAVSTSNEVKPLPKRGEVPTELTWDLSPVYPNDEAWEADFQKLETAIQPFEGLKDTLSQSAQSLLKVLQQRDETGILYGKLRSYAHLRQSEDNANAEAQARADRVDMLGTRRASSTAWIEPEILSMSPEQLKEFVAREPGLKLYEYYLHTLEARRPHVRSAEVEDVLAQAYESMYGTANVFTLFNNADLKFPKIKDERGEEVELTKGRYINFLESPDRRVREDAFRAMHGEYYKWRNTLASTLSGGVKAHVCNARVRSYESALHAALGENEIPVEVYHNLLSTVRERLPVLHRYLRLRKKLLKLDDLQMWDLYVPMVPDVERAMTYEASQTALLESSRPLGSEYIKVLQGGFEQRWVDVPENEGKTSGAYSDGSYVTPPYILMNWQDRLDSTFTLAHEFGHSMHSYFTRQTQPYVYSGYTIFVAEVASTLSEALLTHYLLKQARDAGDKPLQLSLLNQYAERFRTTLYRQTMFAEFELRMHEIVERNEALTAEGMSEKYLQINKDFYGAEVNVDECVSIEWARIPHFYYDFYVYQYATGISAAAALSKQILEEGEPAVQRYLTFLRGGSSDNSINLLRGAGIDMATPQPIHQALDVFEDIIAQMEALAE
jgi:oligoendopeptidase F